MADRETTWQVLQLLFGEEVRNVDHFQKYNFNLVRVCGLSGARALNMSSNVQFQVYEAQSIDGRKHLLFENGEKPHNTIPVCLARDIVTAMANALVLCICVCT